MSDRFSMDIRRNHLQLVREILDRIVPDRDVWAFGSRVNGTARPYSDLDLVILGDELDPGTAADLREAFQNSDLPWKVDVVEWSMTSAPFREIILKGRVEIRKAGDHGLLPSDKTN